MAAAVSSVWAKPGAWALEAEEHEAELKQQQNQNQNQTSSDSSDFPSLAAAATTKTKKKKGQTISLAEFVSPKSAAPQTERLTQAEIVSLPTGPRERSAEELDRSKLGGGFRSYGSNRYGEDSNSSRWGGGSRVSEDGEKRGGFRDRDRDSSGPSRADENDNWAATKKTIGGGGNGFERRERSSGGGFFESQSKADELDSWVSNKPSRFTGGGASERFEKRGSFESLSRNRDSQFGSGGADSDTWGRRREESNGIGGGGENARPRLVLQPRSLPVPVVEVKPERPVTPPPVIVVERVKGANPFGNARPREEVLAEKGQDWKEIEEKLEAVKLKEVAAVIEKKSDGKIGFGLGRKDDDRTERSWRKSTEQSEEGGAQQEEEAASVEEEAKKEEEANKEAETEEEKN